MKSWSLSWVVAGTCLLVAGGARAGEKAPQSAQSALAGGEMATYVQTASHGTFKPVGKGKPNEYLLTLQDVSGSTVYFSSGSERAAGVVATEEFLPPFFAGARPPTASVNPTSPGQLGRSVVVELSDPRYNARRGTLTYRAKVLADRRPVGAASWLPTAAPSLPASFEAVSLFLHFESCPDGYPTCWGTPSGAQNCPTACGGLNEKVGYCWHTESLSCEPCSDDGYKCAEQGICGNAINGPECVGSCSTYHQNCG
ncbi:MAG TPA: hypothetical protein VGS22_04590 [Thermoanaerobaculia bacterium]|jgi:hypothetical protein|nr:hypothetical protein [Thermoanaerobaculia bacterium]